MDGPANAHSHTCVHAYTRARSSLRAKWTDIPVAAKLQEFPADTLRPCDDATFVRGVPMENSAWILRFPSSVDLFVRSHLPFERGRAFARSSFLSRQLAIRLRDWREFRIYNVPPFPVTSTYAWAGNGSIFAYSRVSIFFNSVVGISESCSRN